MEVQQGSDVDPPLEDLEDFADESEVARVRHALLDWYDHNHRTLPWRRNPHSKKDESTQSVGTDVGDYDFAYGVWVSEVMLQQTQVATVISYWNAWVRRWPDVSALAAASEEDVQKAWAGLGYYRRARLLHAGAKALVERHGALEGRPSLPSTQAELLKVPGVGRYTAGAISSIAFGAQEPVVDGNIVRVLSRLLAMPSTLDPASVDAVRHHWKVAGQLVDPDRPGCFNQALMELGAVVCRKPKPECDACPVSFACRALATPGLDPATLPPAKTKVAKDQLASVLVVEARASERGKHGESWVLLTRRPPTGLLANTWEFPMAVVDATGTEWAPGAWPDARERVEDVLQTAVDEIPGVSGLVDGPALAPITHVFSHRRHHMRAASLRLVMRDQAALDALVRPKESAGSLDPGRARWFRLVDLERDGVITTKGPAKVLEAFLNARRQSRLDLPAQPTT